MLESFGAVPPAADEPLAPHEPSPHVPQTDLTQLVSPFEAAPALPDAAIPALLDSIPPVFFEPGSMVPGQPGYAVPVPGPRPVSAIEAIPNERTWRNRALGVYLGLLSAGAALSGSVPKVVSEETAAKLRSAHGLHRAAREVAANPWHFAGLAYRALGTVRGGMGTEHLNHLPTVTAASHVAMHSQVEQLPVTTDAYDQPLAVAHSGHHYVNDEIVNGKGSVPGHKAPKRADSDTIFVGDDQMISSRNEYFVNANNGGIVLKLPQGYSVGKGGLGAGLHRFFMTNGRGSHVSIPAADFNSMRLSNNDTLSPANINAIDQQLGSNRPDGLYIRSDGDALYEIDPSVYQGSGPAVTDGGNGLLERIGTGIGLTELTAAAGVTLIAARSLFRRYSGGRAATPRPKARRPASARRPVTSRPAAVPATKGRTPVITHRRSSWPMLKVPRPFKSAHIVAVEEPVPDGSFYDQNTDSEWLADLDFYDQNVDSEWLADLQQSAAARAAALRQAEAERPVTPTPPRVEPGAQLVTGPDAPVTASDPEDYYSDLPLHEQPYGGNYGRDQED